MNIYFIQCEASPIEGATFSAKFGGAYINGWVKASSLESAKAIFTKSMHDADWNPSEFIEAYRDYENLYSENEERLEFFNQAKLDGEAYQIHTWPIESNELHRKH